MTVSRMVWRTRTTTAGWTTTRPTRSSWTPTATACATARAPRA
ncbi:hypothetical protein DAT35_55615 [Vitiosangium sp. GDMCC 1.1324]|nr:hypothetical protein DAT35_55615 [Vitiosangium sp. GDMCC 1.1324]